MKILPTSYSALDSFETCPLKHYLTRVAKKIDDPPGEAVQWGFSVHKALEQYLGKNISLPVSMQKYQKYADMIRDAYPDAKLLVEQQLAVTENLEPTGWWDKDAWFRGVLDVGVINGKTAYVFDWKTGKQKDDTSQLEMFAALTTVHHPQVEEVRSAFIWLQPQKITKKVIPKKQAQKFWAEIVPRVDRLESAALHDKWPARPSGLCKRYCPVGQRNCEHCGV